MPTVNKNRVTSGGAVKPQESKSPDAGLTQSNIPSNLQKVSQGFNLPACLQDDTDIVLAQNMLTGYVGFADHRSKNWPAMQAAGCETGDPFIYRDNAYIPLRPLEYFLMKCETFRSTMQGQEGKFTFVTRDIETPLSELQRKHPTLPIDKGRGARAEPHYVCLMIVLLQDQSLVPIKADIRGTKTGAVEGPSRAIEAAASPDWGKRGDTHKLSTMFPKPWGRVFHSVTTHPKTGKTSGDGFHVCNAVSTPTSMTLLESLFAAFKDKDFITDIEEADRNFKSRVEHFDKIAVN